MESSQGPSTSVKKKVKRVHLLQDVVFFGHDEQVERRAAALDHLHHLGVALANHRLAVDADHLVAFILDVVGFALMYLWYCHPNIFLMIARTLPFF